MKHIVLNFRYLQLLSPFSDFAEIWYWGYFGKLSSDIKSEVSTSYPKVFQRSGEKHFGEGSTHVR